MGYRIPLLDLRREHAAIAGELREAWAEALAAMRLLGGEAVRRFEEEIAAYIGVPHAVGVGSGSDALRLAVEALDIGRGDRVVVPANAFVAALEALHHVGAEPVLVDVAEDGFAPDEEAVGAALPARAVMVVHLYGHAFDAPRLRRLCEPSGAALIEDASHAHGAALDGRKVGSFGAAGCFSAGVVKNLGAYGDAGFVTTAQAALAGAIRLRQRHGQRRKNEHVLYGHNSRLDELHAITLRVKLRRLDERNRRRRAIAAFYGERLRGIDLQTPVERAGEWAVYHQYVVRTATRERLRRHLSAAGIETGIHYPAPLHLQPAWLRAYGPHRPLPRAERLAGEVVSLPVFPDLGDEEVEDVARAFFGRGARKRVASARGCAEAVQE
jgi:hypothetical protein